MKYNWITVFVAVLAGNVVVAQPVVPDYSALNCTNEPRSSNIDVNPEPQMLSRIQQNAFICSDTWSGSKTDLDLIVMKAKSDYGFENSKHLGRNATMLIPATLQEMDREISNANTTKWHGNSGDGWHNQKAHKEDGLPMAIWNSINSGVKKYVNKFGDEVVYDTKTGKPILDGHMGTKNYSAMRGGGHIELDVKPHQMNDGYKYVGIFYERDALNPNKYYIVDGQTGLRMTRRQVEEFPTTLSDMWRDKGLSCVAEDEKDLVLPTLGSGQSNATQNNRSLTLEDVLDALREDGSGSDMVAAALRDDEPKADEASHKSKESPNNTQPARAKASSQ